MRRVLLPLAALSLLAGCGSHAKPKPAVHRAPAIRVVLRAQDHHPRVGRPWHYAVAVTDRSGRGVPARIHLQILFGGSPVGQVGVRHVADGRWKETIGTDGNAPFPASSVGIPLVFEAVVTARGVTVKRDWPVVVRR